MFCIAGKNKKNKLGFRICSLFFHKSCARASVFFCILFGSELAIASTLEVYVWSANNRILYTIECTDTYCDLEQKIDGVWVGISTIYRDVTESGEVVVSAAATYEFRLLTYTVLYPVPEDGIFLVLSETDLASVDYVLHPLPPLNPGTTTQYSYDALGRLRSVNEDGEVKESVQYDRAGNRCRVASVDIAEEGYCDE